MRAEIGERLRAVRRSRTPEVTQEETDNLMRVKKGRQYSYEKGRAMPPEWYLKRFARLFDTTYEFLKFGEAPPAEDEVQPGANPPPPFTDGGNHPRVGRRKFPVLGSVGAAQFPIDGGSPEDEWVEFDDELYNPFVERFGIRVIGDSMFPRIEHGNIVLVHPVPNKTPGLIVVAKNAESEFVVKYLRQVNGRLELHGVNPDVPPVAVGEGWELVGYVVGRKRKRGYRSPYLEEGDNDGLR